MTLKSTNFVGILPKNYTEMSRKLFDSSTETAVHPDYIGGASNTITRCFLQVTHLLHLDSMA